MSGTALRSATVLITGGGSGIGRRMALGAAARGARIVLWDLSAERLAAVRAELERGGTQVSTQVVNVADASAVRAAATAVLEQVGTVDVVINNAGVVSGKPILETTDEAIERTYAVNVLALYWVTRAFLPAMVAQGRGHIVTVASAAGLLGVARQTDYSASKHAAVGFDESLRQEMRAERTGVRTTVVCPYYINTGMFEGVKTRFPLLLPILDESEVAEAVLNGIERGKERIVLPWFVNTVPLARILPVRLFDRVMDTLGINKTMDHFTGRPGDVVGAGGGDKPAASPVRSIS